MLFFFLSFILWAVIHSITASSRFKAWAREVLGDRAYEGTYRLLYNALAAVTILPVLATGALALPQQIMWEVERPFNWLFVAIQLIGVIGLGASLLQTDVMRFVGLGQFIRYLRGDDELNPRPILTTTGVYGLVRHPLYFFSLLLLWFSPVMTLPLLVFDVAATVYFWVGSAHEERRLAMAFGDKYEVYRNRVPRLLPLKIRT
jgi:protein-S-isoprenylcysteine O-methyltransferase Ste14